MSRLIDVEAKIERAKKHVRDFNAAVSAFYDVRPHELRPEFESDSGDWVYRIQQVRPTPGDWPEIIGDVASNLRTALNYLVCSLVVKNHKAVTHQTQFPIGDSSTQYGSPKTARMVEGISPAAKAVLDGVRPYAGGNDLLWALAVISNSDKHRVRLGTVVTWKNLAIGVSKGTFVAVLQNRLPLVDGAEVGRLKAAGDEPQHPNLKLTYDVSFAEPEVVKGQPVLPTLDHLLGAVSQVVDKFRPLLV